MRKMCSSQYQNSLTSEKSKTSSGSSISEVEEDFLSE